MILSLVTKPDPRLLQKSREVLPSEFGSELDQFMEDMVESMKTWKGIGLAGVQVGDMRRILIAVINGQPVMMVNPVITHKSNLTKDDVEGCLSLPGVRTKIKRPRAITVSFLTPMGESMTLDLMGMNARVVQHEMDHLDGKTIA